MDIHALVEQKISEDTAFQETLATLEEAEQAEALETKRKEVLETEFASLSAKAQEADKAKELADNYKIRAEKAEKGSAKQAEGLSIGDTLYLAKADIHEEDISDVLTYAQKMGVSVKDAHAFYKPVLKERQEIRQTALATQTGGGNRGTKSASPEVLLRKAESGEISEDDIEKLTEARMAQRTSR
jgi:hypothetical protein